MALRCGIRAGQGAHRTEYVLNARGATWYEYDVADSASESGIVGDGARRYFGRHGAGRRLVAWPAGAGNLAPTNGESVVYRRSCRTSRALAVSFSPLTDTTTGHESTIAPREGLTSRFRFYENGKLVDDQPNVAGGWYRVPTGRTTYRMTAQAALAGFLTSTSSTVDLGFTSAAGAGGRPPPHWNCEFAGTGRCTVPPMRGAHRDHRGDVPGQRRDRSHACDRGTRDSGPC